MEVTHCRQAVNTAICLSTKKPEGLPSGFFVFHLITLYLHDNFVHMINDKIDR